jgi:hypothetical protein
LPLLVSNSQSEPQYVGLSWNRLGCQNGLRQVFTCLCVNDRLYSVLLWTFLRLVNQVISRFKVLTVNDAAETVRSCFRALSSMQTVDPFKAPIRECTSCFKKPGLPLEFLRLLGPYAEFVLSSRPVQWSWERWIRTNYLGERRVSKTSEVLLFDCHAGSETKHAFIAMILWQIDVVTRPNMSSDTELVALRVVVTKHVSVTPSVEPVGFADPTMQGLGVQL